MYHRQTRTQRIGPPQVCACLSQFLAYGLESQHSTQALNQFMLLMSGAYMIQLEYPNYYELLLAEA
jgi:hypothetical protein